MLRWFNLQSITEVKSQLETMHLIFGAPRWLCSRGFSHLWARTEKRKLKSIEDMQRSTGSSDRLSTKSEVENYWERVHWEVPSEEHLKEKHPVTNVPFWKDGK